MKTLLIALLLISSSSAFAGTYTRSNQVQKECQRNGKLAGMAFDARGESEAEFETLKAPAMNLGDTEAAKGLIEQALDYGFKFADSKKDAYMTSWSRCMDTYNY